MVSCPTRSPVAAGVKVTWKPQLAPGATLKFSQLLDCANSLVMAGVVTTRALLPAFVRVTVCAVLVDPYICAGNVRAVGSVVAVVRDVPAVKRGVCQIPRP